MDGLVARRTALLGLSGVNGFDVQVRPGVFALLSRGVVSAVRAPSTVLGLWLATLVVTLPLALAVRAAMAEHLGSSLEADSVAEGANFDWIQEFGDQATGPARAMTPAVIGFAAVLDNLSAVVDLRSRPLLVFAAAGVHLVLMIFLAGGVIDRLARDRPTGTAHFFAACGTFFPRFLRLAVMSSIAYGIIFGPFHSWLFNVFEPQLTRDMTAERSVAAVRLLCYVALLIPTGLLNLLFDYAKVRAVVEDRRSMLGALGAASRFLSSNFRAAAALYLLDGVIFLLVLAVYALIAPNVGRANWTMWLTFGIGQTYVAARLWVKVMFWACEIELFQSRLGHAGFVRRPIQERPVPPMVEHFARHERT